MSDMPHARPPYLQRETTRFDKTVWYVRRERHGPRIRLKAEYGTEKFWQEYQAALSGLSPQPTKVAAGTLAWLVERYREVKAWTSLSPATRRQRENILRHVLDKAGDQKISKITRAHIVAGRDRREATPRRQGWPRVQHRDRKDRDDGDGADRAGARCDLEGGAMW